MSATGAVPRGGRADVLLVAGGTGGHVYPAIAVARALASGDPPARSSFAVDARPASRDAVDRAGFDAAVVPIRRGLQRGRSAAALRANARVAVDLVRAAVASLRILRAVRPRVVVGFGAYVSLPVIVVARLLRIPVVVHEQNGRAGLANRVAVRLGARPAVSVPGTPLRGAVLTGNPVRPEIAATARLPVAPPLVGVVGASLGAGVLNDATLDLYDRWRGRDDVAVELVTGPAPYDDCTAHLERLRRDDDRLEFAMVPYEHDMAALYRDATVMVTRGGGSVWELAAVGMPAVVVPWAGAAEDHQTANARACANAGGAVHLPESHCDGARLARELDALLTDPERLERMSAAMRSLARPGAARAVADLVRQRAGIA